MRLRKNKKRFPATHDTVDAESEVVKTVEITAEGSPDKVVEMEKPSRPPLRFLRRMFDNPNFGFQLMVIILTLSSDHMQMDRRIDGMTTTVDKIRNISEILNNTMGSVKAAAEAPKKIRRLLE